MTMKINDKNRTIEMTKTFADKASRYGITEYNDLQNARRDYPNYKVVTIARKAPKTAQPAYKGLTYEYMERYIKSHDDENKSIAKEYLELRGETDEADEMMGESASYQEVKEWFLNTFPAIAEYHEKRTQKVEEIKQGKEAKRQTRIAQQKKNRRTILLTA